ncbi:aldehyde reductase [Westerdykella ornata]|uniref:Aldehyde reductase n=1 Tax=Westerdykella ornata TaxID=318751 RepID=A0A6A6JK95_WESOR|nr:aldehyde reductase [Westerdykella ornata]KAF2276533.1 aldehyde reductase [Westerdykella ornata]
MTVKKVFGGASIGDWGFSEKDDVDQLFAFLKNAGVKEVDTAIIYPKSEEKIGRSITGYEDLLISTKLPGGFQPGTLTKDNILKAAQNSLDSARVKQFDVLYIHAPDPSADLNEALDAINELYKKGIFVRFGLSNFTAEQVQEVYDIAKSKGYVLPTVYQGNYNPIARKLETLLFPTLRKLGIAFYAYSPLAGGFLAKTKEQIEAGEGRFNENALGGMYLKLYKRPAYLEALSEWNNIAEAEGVSKAELAYRWVAYHGALKEELGDAVIFAGRNFEQVEQTAKYLDNGPLSKESAQRIEEIWAKVEPEAVIDNYHG